MFRRFGNLAALSSALALGLALLTPPARAMQPRSALQTPPKASARTPIGMWLTANGKAVVQIMPCGPALCGRIAGLARAPDAPMPTNVAGRAQCGLVVIHAVRTDGGDAWLGTVTDPRDGDTFGARLRVDPAGNLRLRGFLLIPLLGETATWHPFTGKLGAACSMS